MNYILKWLISIAGILTIAVIMLFCFGYESAIFTGLVLFVVSPYFAGNELKLQDKYINKEQEDASKITT